MNIRYLNSAQERRAALIKETGARLDHVAKHSVADEKGAAHNCENMIGQVRVPLGVAGPLKIHFLKSSDKKKAVTRDMYVPLATTEGALVASISRGCKALTAAGGVRVTCERVGATRGPVFFVKNLEEQEMLRRFLETRFNDCKKIAGKTSKHLTLTEITSQGVGRYRYVRFVFHTQDAMGMNMATFASEELVQFIEAKTGARCVSIAGNYDVDKKPSWLNFINGRGMRVSAEAEVSGDILRTVLKTNARAMAEVWQVKSMLGSVMSGTMGANAQVANVAAAIFLATGQDIAQVSEASLAVTTMEVIGKKEENLYVSVYMPDVMVGTVGGGTGLPTQRESLALLGVAGGDHGEYAERLASVVGATALAGEISLLASLSEGTLARAHKKLARKLK